SCFQSASAWSWRPARCPGRWCGSCIPPRLGVPRSSAPNDDGAARAHRTEKRAPPGAARGHANGARARAHGAVMARSSGKVALITGVTGQDGAYLAEFLLARGYVVHGIKRRSSSFNTERIDPLIHDPHEAGVSFHLHYGDVTDATNIIRIVQ